jgi:hypothetical protein
LSINGTLLSKDIRMQCAIKHPKFRFLPYNKKVYIIQRPDKLYPLCEGKCEYYTVPIQLSNHISYRNMLIGYTTLKDCTKAMANDKTVKKVVVTCKDAKSIATMLSVPLAVLIDKNRNEIFFAPVRK